MSIAIVDYDAGNLRSVEAAFTRLGAGYRIIREGEDLSDAERLVVPGVGDARAAMDILNARGLAERIREFVARGRPVLGICLGAQIILDYSQESNTECLGLIAGSAVAFTPKKGLKIPHMGWNTIIPTASHPLLRGLEEDHSFYFVHSYVPRPVNAAAVLAECEYGESFAAVVGRENLVATQFHPEKSGEPGLKMLRNFLEWRT